VSELDLLWGFSLSLSLFLFEIESWKKVYGRDSDQWYTVDGSIYFSLLFDKK
jgi:hypothetical protein